VYWCGKYVYVMCARCR